MALELSGTTQVIVEMTRAQAGQQLEPPVSSRTVQKYLDLASLFLPAFTFFRAEEGGLNRYAKLTPFHLPVLQEIRSYARRHGMKKLRLKLAYEPAYFEELNAHTTHKNNNHESYQEHDRAGSRRKIPSATTQTIG